MIPRKPFDRHQPLHTLEDWWFIFLNYRNSASFDGVVVEAGFGFVGAVFKTSW